MNFRAHVLADVASWPPVLQTEWRAAAQALSNYGPAERDLRAWVEARRGPQAVEPVVLNRHHLTPSDPQPLGSEAWPLYSIYCGRASRHVPKLGRPGSEPWRFSHILSNPFKVTETPDALELYRRGLRAELRLGVSGSPILKAISELTPRSALVCSCVTSPWTPEAPDPQERLPPAFRCHCQLIVAVWRFLNSRRTR